MSMDKLREVAARQFAAKRAKNAIKIWAQKRVQEWNRTQFNLVLEHLGLNDEQPVWSSCNLSVALPHLHMSLIYDVYIENGATLTILYRTGDYRRVIPVPTCVFHLPVNMTSEKLLGDNCIPVRKVKLDDAFTDDVVSALIGLGIIKE